MSKRFFLNVNIVAIFILLLTCSFGYTKGNISVDYTSSVYPGDVISITIQSTKASDVISGTATLYVENIEEALLSSNIYSVGSNTFTSIIPLSSWYEQGNFRVELIYSQNDNDPVHSVLPIKMLHKDFIEETLYLNAQNTAVKTDDSSQRMKQIEELNKLLGTTNEDAIHFIGTFIHPVDYVYHTSYFGDRRNYEYSNGNSSIGLHYGLDYRASIGTPTYACADGKVVMATMRNSSGNSIVIEHLPGFYSLYYHLDSMDVKVGDMVKQGEEIGKTGKTGLATGPHLHWEVRINGIAVDPAYFLETPLVME